MSKKNYILGLNHGEINIAIGSFLVKKHFI